MIGVITTMLHVHRNGIQGPLIHGLAVPGCR
jgi:hypothetical protein